MSNKKRSFSKSIGKSFSKSKMKRNKIPKRRGDISPFQSYNAFLEQWKHYVQKVSETYGEIKNDLAEEIGRKAFNVLSEKEIEQMILKHKKRRKSYEDILFIFDNILTKMEPLQLLKEGERLSYQQKINRSVLGYRQSYYEEFPDLITPNTIIIYRSIKKENMDKINLDTVGEHWSWYRWSAKPYAGELGNEYIIVAIVNKDDVNWEESIVRNTDPIQSGEREIYLNIGTPITVIDIIEDDYFITEAEEKWKENHPKGYKTKAD